MNIVKAMARDWSQRTGGLRLGKRSSEISQADCGLCTHLCRWDEICPQSYQLWINITIYLSFFLSPVYIFLIIWPDQPNDQSLTCFLTASFSGTTKYLQIITLSEYNRENSMEKSIYTIRIQGHKNKSTIEKESCLLGDN